jgi:putative cardiolipin synthase
MRRARWLRACWLALALAVALALGGGLLAGCASLPSLAGRTPSTALTDTGATRLGQAIAPLVAGHGADSGIYPLVEGRDAFAARVLLADAAERSLDVQYYIWRNDITGTLLLQSLRAAADRGVRVRLLLDDNNTTGLDPTLALLDAHRNIEVRLFNPFVLRGPRMLGYLTDFARLNRRMHNKSFTADGQATIVGGRNVGDEYFGAAGEVLFTDLDVLAIGPVVGAVSNDFDRYWNSASSYPLATLVAPATPASAAALREQAERIENAPAAQAYQVAMRESTFVAELAAGRLPVEWAATRLVSDDPAKALDQAAPDRIILPQLIRIFGEPAAEFDLVSPYFVPGEAGTASFTAMTGRGVKVRVLTNSLEATDVAAVHAGYAKWRKPLLAAGVSLHELKRIWPQASEQKRAGPLGSSAASLHAKTFAVDHARVFIGSFNFDPRSARLNTEMGFVIDSPALARELESTLDMRLGERAYEVRLAPNGDIYWLEHDQAGRAIRHDTEPGTGFWKRVGVRLMSLLPIDWLL